MSTVASSNNIVYGSDDAGAVSVNGGRGRSKQLQREWRPTPTICSPTCRRVQPSPDSIEEFRVITILSMRNTARNSGSVSNVVTSRGPTTGTGNLYEFFRNKVLNSNEYWPYVYGKVCLATSLSSTRTSLAALSADRSRKIEPSSLLLTKGAVSARASLAGGHCARRPRKRRLPPTS